MSVPFYDPFNVFYQTYSRRISDLVIPAHFRKYAPIPKNDSTCLSVIAVSPERGASSWTYRGKWITIGIYRDTGRPISNGPWVNGVSWVRVATLLTLTVNSGHGVAPLDKLELTGINLDTIATVIAITDTTIVVRVKDVGTTSGTGNYRLSNYNFAEKNCIFRILPDPKIVPLSLVDSLFASTAPTTIIQDRMIHNVTTDTDQQVTTAPVVVTGHPQNGFLSLDRRFDQIYDSIGDPLAIQYRVDGQAADVTALDSTTQNERVYDSAPIHTEQVDWNNAGNLRVYIYDLYGLDVNDNTRTPFHSSTLVTRNLTIPGFRNNILRAPDNTGAPIVQGPLFDEFGNEAIGILANNALKIKARILPLTVDRFNRPTATPLP